MACSLAWLAQLAGWHWLVTINATKIQPIRRNEDESTDGSLDSKIDSISKDRRESMCDAMYVRIYTNERDICASREINNRFVKNYNSLLCIISSLVLRAKRIRQCEKMTKRGNKIIK